MRYAHGLSLSLFLPNLSVMNMYTDSTLYCMYSFLIINIVYLLCKILDCNLFSTSLIESVIYVLNSFHSLSSLGIGRYVLHAYVPSM